MSEKTEKRRADLRARILDAAEAVVIVEGMSAVKARDLATKAGCALGAIYNVFDDMTQVVLEVNSRTYKRLGAAVAEAMAQVRDAPPVDQLVALGHAYLHFADSNTNAWRTLFDIPMSAETGVPEWYIDETKRLLHNISGPLSQVRPDLTPENLSILCRALFSSVHGIVILGLEKRITAVPEQDLAPMIEVIIRNYVGSQAKI
ncbi:transcriptional regulator, TetR family [Candidatus Rhodobacter oscarellae]|uniref:Transcriptional regulator, TetR family n=1 Tax=Candidatus Rhodobacter oscarellae TaxID=1675527 RepID=A0A0J9E2H5_9RHOB|nr:TetR/AcrR family transcriptional regulator [Candidatus Rhodobacter lobularis]KMW57061.1 transcriptional regulator, TetR family [Candidatus Rhodobacter lobularis]